MTTRLVSSGNMSSNGDTVIDITSIVSNKFLLILSGDFGTGNVEIQADTAFNLSLTVVNPADGAIVELDAITAAGAYPFEMSGNLILLALRSSTNPDLDWLLYAAPKGN